MEYRFLTLKSSMEGVSLVSLLKRRNQQTSRVEMSSITPHLESGCVFMALCLINISFLPLKKHLIASIWQTSGSSAGALAPLTVHFIVFCDKHLQSIFYTLDFACVWPHLTLFIQTHLWGSEQKLM